MWGDWHISHVTVWSYVTRPRWQENSCFLQTSVYSFFHFFWSISDVITLTWLFLPLEALFRSYSPITSSISPPLIPDPFHPRHPQSSSPSCDLSISFCSCLPSWLWFSPPPRLGLALLSLIPFPPAETTLITIPLPSAREEMKIDSPSGYCSSPPEEKREAVSWTQRIHLPLEGVGAEPKGSGRTKTRVR